MQVSTEELQVSGITLLISSAVFDGKWHAYASVVKVLECNSGMPNISYHFIQQKKLMI